MRNNVRKNLKKTIRRLRREAENAGYELRYTLQEKGSNSAASISSKSKVIMSGESDSAWKLTQAGKSSSASQSKSSTYLYPDSCESSSAISLSLDISIMIESIENPPFGQIIAQTTDAEEAAR